MNQQRNHLRTWSTTTSTSITWPLECLLNRTISSFIRHCRLKSKAIRSFFRLKQKTVSNCFRHSITTANWLSIMTQLSSQILFRVIRKRTTLSKTRSKFNGLPRNRCKCFKWPKRRTWTVKTAHSIMIVPLISLSEITCSEGWKRIRS